jgi:threonine aldolase
MVFVRTAQNVPELEQGLLSRGVQTRWSGNHSRMVVHLDVSEADIKSVLAAMSSELND